MAQHPRPTAPTYSVRNNSLTGTLLRKCIWCAPRHSSKTSAFTLAGFCAKRLAVFTKRRSAISQSRNCDLSPKFPQVLRRVLGLVSCPRSWTTRLGIFRVLTLRGGRMAPGRSLAISGACSDSAVGADLVVVPAPFRHLRPGIVKAEEPVGVQALGPELAVDGLDEGIVRGLSRPAEPAGSAQRIQARRPSGRPTDRGRAR